MKRIKCFLSYSHYDMDFKLKLLEHFSSINKAFNIDFWHDGLIDAGGHIDEEVLAELSTSDVIILLISSSYISSNFCYNIEMKKAFEREEKGECIIVPVLLKSTSLNDSMPFYNLKTLPTDRKPIASFRPKDKGYADVTDNLMGLLNNKFNKRLNDKVIVSEKNSSPRTSNVTVPYMSPYINIVQNGTLAPFILNQELVSLITKTNKNIVEVSSKINEIIIEHTKLYYNKITNRKYRKATPKEKRVMLQQFLFDIFLEIKIWLFPFGGVRIHVRGLKNNNYECIIALTEEKGENIDIDWSKELKTMSLNSMICHSSKIGLPMVKSLNLKYHEKGNHDTTWKDYLTCSFNTLYHLPNPLMSFGISLHKNNIKYYPNLLVVIAYLRLDLQLEYSINRYVALCKEIDKSYDIKKVVESF